ncbi:MAG: SDR family oxidoreductase, partial [Acidobacteria bacterium]|nr:SDR family oxidoreductase [Acidobacteriota bacterium]
MAYSFENRVMVVTGGAGDIGGAICRALEAGGARVVAVDVDAAAPRNARVGFLRLDVSDSAEVDRVFGQVESEWGPIDGLVNAAGIAPTAFCTEGSDADWRRTLEVNLSGVYYCSRRAARGMIERQRGTIVNISSTNGLVGEE